MARKKKAQAEPASRGLDPRELAPPEPPAAIRGLGETIQGDGGCVVGAYRDPLGGHWQILAGLPLEKVLPTPYQRDLSEAHVERLSKAIGGIDRFLDPVVAFRTPEGTYWSPNGRHRAEALRRLGGRSITAIVVADETVARRILALNVEKAHNLKEKALEVIRLARGIAEVDPRPEREFETEFEEPALLTLGLSYERKARFAGGAYHPVLKRVEAFLGSPLPVALATREGRAEKLLELDEAVSEAVGKLKERGFENPYLKAFVVARINPLRFRRKGEAGFEETIEKMLAAARRFDESKVRGDQIAASSGPPPES